jgi:hypothetical protein
MDEYAEPTQRGTRAVDPHAVNLTPGAGFSQPISAEMINGRNPIGLGNPSTANGHPVQRNGQAGHRVERSDGQYREEFSAD